MVTTDNDMELQGVLNNLTQVIGKLVSEKEPANPPHVIWLQDYAATSGSKVSQTNQRFISEGLVISASTTGSFTLNNGRYKYTFNVVAGTVYIPFPLNIDSGVDLSITATTADIDVYVIAQVVDK